MTLAALQAIGNRETISGKAIAVFADPVFEKNDPRVLNNSTALAQTADEIQLSLVLRNFTETDRLAKISRLPATLREAQAISAVIPHNESLITMGFAANKQQVLNEGCKTFAFCISRLMACSITIIQSSLESYFHWSMSTETLATAS